MKRLKNKEEEEAEVFLTRLRGLWKDMEKIPEKKRGKRTKAEYIEERVKTVEKKVENLEINRDELEKNIERERIDLKKEMAAFIFQSVSIIVGIIVIILTISIGFSISNLSDESEKLSLIAGFLLTLVIVFVIWFILWMIKNFKKTT